LTSPTADIYPGNGQASYESRIAGAFRFDDKLAARAKHHEARQNLSQAKSVSFASGGPQ